MTKTEFAKAREAHAPTWLVDLPKGTSVHGAVALYHLLWAQSNRAHTLHIVFGTHKPMVKSFEGHAEILSRTIFPRLSPREVLERHTIFGFYSRFMSEPVADAWAGELISERGAAARVRRFLTQRDGHFFKQQQWYCQRCVEEDRTSWGYTTWRYIHQVHGLDLCPDHEFPLVAHCGVCANPYDQGTHFRLPGDACRVCGSFTAEQGATPTEGMRQLARHCGETADGRLTWMRPERWAQWIRAFLSSLGGDFDRAAVLVEQELHRSWNGSIPFGINKSTIEYELQLLGGASTALHRIAIFGATIRLAEFDSEIVTINEDQSVLEATLSSHNLPVGISSDLLQFKPLKRVASQARTSVKALRSALRELPEGLKLKVTWAEGRGAGPIEQSAVKNLDTARLRAKHRRKIKWALETWPDATRTTLWKKLPLPMMWLSKHDREWLDATRPQKIVRGDEAFGTTRIGQKSDD
ncbi:TniQ family protein [Acidovorax sp.]|uniref:TniQ family protein n=1 Tax=Acidovorax sp. TaxID=1872122 RepID=UPI0025BBC166|nr:TniQ family protein [Acidovorax sp.]